jgi:hypothetical protein
MTTKYLFEFLGREHNVSYLRLQILGSTLEILTQALGLHLSKSMRKYHMDMVLHLYL